MVLICDESSMKNKFSQDFIHHSYSPLRKIKTAWQGFIYVMKYDKSVTYKVIISLVLLGVSIRYRELVDVVIILLITGVMIIAEMFNSCVELLCDFHETGYNRPFS